MFPIVNVSKTKACSPVYMKRKLCSYTFSVVRKMCQGFKINDFLENTLSASPGFSPLFFYMLCCSEGCIVETWQAKNGLSRKVEGFWTLQQSTFPGCEGWLDFRSEWLWTQTSSVFIGSPLQTCPARTAFRRSWWKETVTLRRHQLFHLLFIKLTHIRKKQRPFNLFPLSLIHAVAEAERAPSKSSVAIPSSKAQEFLAKLSRTKRNVWDRSRPDVQQWIMQFMQMGFDEQVSFLLLFCCCWKTNEFLV